jgi:hypothetical protein
MTRPDDAAHRALLAALKRAVDDACAYTNAVQSPQAVLPALDRVTAQIRALDGARRELGALARKLIGTALAAGVDHRDLESRPFSREIVRKIRRALGLPALRRGPRPRITPTAGAPRGEDSCSA